MNHGLIRNSIFAALLLLHGAVAAQVPQLINYQGRVAVGTVNFDGSGQFKFALVGSGGGTTFWSNDGTSTNGSQPTTAVTLTVTKGLYSVLLGDTTLTNMTAVPTSVFTHTDVWLRVWFNDGPHGFQLLTPDQRITAAGYAMLAGGLDLPTTTSAKVGVITQNGGTSLLHTFGENFFAGLATGNFTMSGFGNTGIGSQVLFGNTTGNDNTASGEFALYNNTTGNGNTAQGQATLSFNTIGNYNTANGYNALNFNTTGSHNTALGDSTLVHNTSGNNNTAIGVNAGTNLTTGNNNIDIGNQGIAGESNIIRIGTSGTHADTYLAGVIHGDGSGLTGITATVAAGSITSTQIANNAITSTQLASGLTLGGTTTGTFSGNLTGNVTGSVSGSAASFTGTLAGDVTGTQGATAIAATTVTGKALTGFSSTTGTITTTDSILSAINKLNGNLGLKAPIASPTFTGAVTAPSFSGALTGNVTGNVTGSAASFTGTLAGDVTGTQVATVVATVGTSTAANVHAAEVLANAATSASTASAIVKRDGSGDFTTHSLTLTAALTLPTTTSSGTVGLITQNGAALLHTFGGSRNFFAGTSAGNFTMTGLDNTAIGTSALGVMTSGSSNTAVGNGSLAHDTTGGDNTAVGLNSLNANTTGGENTAMGVNALRSNVTANQNVAVGSGALQTQSFSNAGTTWNSNNVAVGYNALFANQPTAATNGFNNTAVGTIALQGNTVGSNNVSVGYNSGSNASYSGSTNVLVGAFAGSTITSGSNNIMVGYNSGNTTTGSNNLYIGNASGTATESGIIRIGTPGTHTDTFLAGIIHGDGSGLTGVTATVAAGSITSTQLASGLTLGGTTTGTFSGNLTGNVTGNVNGNASTATTAGNATNFTGTLAGDVTGTQSATTVAMLRGVPVSTVAPAIGQALIFNGTAWVPQGVTPLVMVQTITANAPLVVGGSSSAPMLSLDVVPVSNGGTGSASKNFVDLTTDQTISGVKAFQSYGTFANGIQVVSTDLPGVNAVSDTGDAILGASNSSAGVHGICVNGPAVFGESTAHTGVRGQSGTGYGVWGTSTSFIAVNGDSNSNTGVQGTSNTGVGVYGQSVSGYAGAFGGRVGISGDLSVGGRAGISGDLSVAGTLSKGGGSFKIDHPQDPANKYLSHSFVESPDMMNIYNGMVVTDAQGEAVVSLPDYFMALNRDYRYQLTVIGQFAQAIVAEEVSDNHFTIKTSVGSVKVSWQVTGIRKDAFANAHRIPEVEEKVGEERGNYLHPELFGQPEAKSISRLGLPANPANLGQPTATKAEDKP